MPGIPAASVRSYLRSYYDASLPSAVLTPKTVRVPQPGAPVPEPVAEPEAPISEGTIEEPVDAAPPDDSVASVSVATTATEASPRPAKRVNKRVSS